MAVGVRQLGATCAGCSSMPIGGCLSGFVRAQWGDKGCADRTSRCLFTSSKLSAVCGGEPVGMLGMTSPKTCAVLSSIPIGLPECISVPLTYVISQQLPLLLLFWYWQRQKLQ
jgi:hypothetical protein